MGICNRLLKLPALRIATEEEKSGELRAFLKEGMRSRPRAHISEKQVTMLKWGKGVVSEVGVG